MPLSPSSPNNTATPQSNLPGVILAGGLATRMGGGDKGRLMLGGQSLFQHVIARLGPQVDRLALNANGDPARFADLGLPVLPDSLPDYPGPLAGILAALDWAATLGASAVVTAAADTPFLPQTLVAGLQAATSPTGLALAATKEGTRLQGHPTFGLWPVALRDDLHRALLAGERKVTAWTDRKGAGIALFPATPIDPFFNINTPDDLARAEAACAV